jgi:hypothetical protein
VPQIGCADPGDEGQGGGRAGGGQHVQFFASEGVY